MRLQMETGRGPDAIFTMKLRSSTVTRNEADAGPNSRVFLSGMGSEEDPWTA